MRGQLPLKELNIENRIDEDEKLSLLRNEKLVNSKSNDRTTIKMKFEQIVC